MVKASCLWRNVFTWLIVMYVDARWLIVILLSSSIYGLLSSVIAARKLFFLAGALPHAALKLLPFDICYRK